MILIVATFNKKFQSIEIFKHIGLIRKLSSDEQSLKQVLIRVRLAWSFGINSSSFIASFKAIESIRNSRTFVSILFNEHKKILKSVARFSVA